MRDIKFFESASAFRRWLERHHARERELWVGFFKKHSGKSGITYAEAVDEALCFGWIDGLKQRVDEWSYRQRFTPRQPRSNWSRLNILHVERLTKSSRMTPAGQKVFRERDPARCGIYSFENPPQKLEPAEEKRFKVAKRAWGYFYQQAPSYQRTAIWWVVSAKQSATRSRRLAQLMADSSHGRRLSHLSPAK